jgi:hypothetical protein
VSLHLPSARAFRSSTCRPCSSCVQRKAFCLLFRSGQTSACIECQGAKRRCDVRDEARILIASGQVRGAEDIELGVSTIEDVQSLGLDRTGETILAHVVLLKQDILDLRLRLDARLRAIELRLCDLEVCLPDEGEPSDTGDAKGGRNAARGQRSSDGDEAGHDGYAGGSESDLARPEISYDEQESDRESQESDYTGQEGESAEESGSSLYA